MVSSWAFPFNLNYPAVCDSIKSNFLWELRTDLPSLFLPMAQLGLKAVSPEVKDYEIWFLLHLYWVVTFCYPVLASHIASHLRVSECSEHEVSQAVKICSSLKLLMSIVAFVKGRYLMVFVNFYKSYFLSLWGHPNPQSHQLVFQAILTSGLMWKGCCFTHSMDIRLWEYEL